MAYFLPSLDTQMFILPQMQLGSLCSVRLQGFFSIHCQAKFIYTYCVHGCSVLLSPQLRPFALRSCSVSFPIPSVLTDARVCTCLCVRMDMCVNVHRRARSCLKMSSLTASHLNFRGRVSH